MRQGQISLLVIAALATACEPDRDRITTDELVEAGLLVSGFDTPESVLHDENADLYLVSNINGNPFAEDDNGYISRVSTDGRVLARKWIDGAEADVTLNAPKGMAVRGDTLFVSDISVVRLFSRLDGTPLGEWPVEGAAFLNDLSATEDYLYVTDSGVDEQFADAGSSALYRFDGAGAVEMVETGEYVPALNGVHATEDRVMLVSYAGAGVFSIDSSGVMTAVAEPGNQLDGLVLTATGGMIVSDWETGSVIRIGSDGESSVILDQLSAPADIGFDRQRNRVLIPLFSQGQVIIQQLGG